MMMCGTDATVDPLGGDGEPAQAATTVSAATAAPAPQTGPRRRRPPSVADRYRPLDPLLCRTAPSDHEFPVRHGNGTDEAVRPPVRRPADQRSAASRRPG